MEIHVRDMKEISTKKSSYRQHDYIRLQLMLKSSLESLKHKIDLEAMSIANELLTYSEEEVREIIINKLK